MDDIYLNELESQPGMYNINTQICFCFPVAEDSETTRSTMVNTLVTGLERLAKSFPWVAGQVKIENPPEGKVSGDIKIVPLDKAPRLTVKDYTKDQNIPSFETMAKSNFPISMFDENLFCSRPTLAFNLPASEPTPAFVCQANFVRGGLLLSVIGQHNAMDMTGQGELMRLLSKACTGVEFTKEEIANGNPTNRRNIIPLLGDSYTPGPEIEHQLSKPAAKSTEATDSSRPSKSTWANISFSALSLAALKSKATAYFTLPSGSYFSTDDTLCAFVWQSIVRARLQHLSPTEESWFARAVDVRRYLDISPDYPGLMQNMAYSHFSVQSLVDQPLGSIAAQMRQVVDPKICTLKYDTQALSTFLHRAPDKNVVSFTAPVDSSSGMSLSSWAKIDVYSLDFGLGLGTPVEVRRPLFDPVESLIYFLPKKPDGEVTVALCLRDDDLERLKSDEEFVRYGNYIG